MLSTLLRAMLVYYLNIKYCDNSMRYYFYYPHFMNKETESIKVQ